MFIFFIAITSLMSFVANVIAEICTSGKSTIETKGTIVVIASILGIIGYIAAYQIEKKALRKQTKEEYENALKIMKNIEEFALENNRENWLITKEDLEEVIHVRLYEKGKEYTFYEITFNKNKRETKKTTFWSNNTLGDYLDIKNIEEMLQEKLKKIALEELNGSKN